MNEYKSILTDIRNKIYKPIYLLMGEEPYFIDKISDYIEQTVLTEPEKAFNLMIFYGKDSTALNIIHTCNRFPMMANHQVVIIKEAQDLKDFDQLIYYIEKPLKSTILVICYKYKKLDKRKKITALLMKNAVVFESDKIKEDKLLIWINEYLKQKRYTITPQASAMLIDHAGNDLGKLANELNKLIIVLGDKEAITPDAIEKNIGISKEFNTFELNNALGERNIYKANRIANYLAKNQRTTPIIVTITNLYSYFCKLLVIQTTHIKDRNKLAAEIGVHPFYLKDYEKAARHYPINRIKQIIPMLREYDLKAKGMGSLSAENGDLLRELVFKILH